MNEPLRLLYRADWTAWSLSAQVVRRVDRTARAELTDQLSQEWGKQQQGIFHFLQLAQAKPASASADADWAEVTERLLIAPGGRYRFERDDSTDDDDHDADRVLVICDGQSCWDIRDGKAREQLADPLDTPIGHIVRPAWMTHQLKLTPAGTTQVAGRTAYQVAGSPRLPSDPWTGLLARFQSFEISIDAELGLVLRCATVFRDQVISTDELAELVIDPPAARDPAGFRPPAEVEIDPSPIGVPSSYHPRRWRDWDPCADPDKDRIAPAAMARSAAKGALYLTARRLTPPERPAEAQASSRVGDRLPADDEATMPAATLGQVLADPGSAGTPISDATLDLIAHTKIPPLTLTALVHYWVDATRLRRGMPGLADGSALGEAPITTSFLGADNDNFLRTRDSHRVAVLKVAMPDRYLIDFQRDDRPRFPLVMACDGGRLRKAYHNRVVTSPPQLLPTSFARLLDPAWLLGSAPLREAGEQTVDGRTAIRVVAELPRYRAARESRPDRSAAVVLLIDTELGIVLEQVSYIDGEPVIRYELRDVQAGQAFDPAEFEVAIEAEFEAAIAPDLPVIETDGEPIGDLDLPDAARAAGRVTSELAGGARSAFDWLAARARNLTDPPPRP